MQVFVFNDGAKGYGVAARIPLKAKTRVALYEGRPHVGCAKRKPMENALRDLEYCEKKKECHYDIMLTDNTFMTLKKMAVSGFQ